jgi:7-carboxy-7-deazaguanine synthase
VTLSEKALREPPEERLVELKKKKRDDTVLVHEIYASVQGESTHAGRPCTFVRTTGCHLRCVYCDTEHAFHAGTERTVDDIVAEVKRIGVPLVELTGGEPLLQKSALALVTRLLDDGFEVLIETSGGVSVDGVDRRARLIVDVKTPGSGEAAKNVWKNLEKLTPAHDEVKVVVCSESDYAWAVDVVKTRPIPAGVTVLFSPSFPGLAPATLAEWVARDAPSLGGRVRFQLQMHKVLWGEKPGV